ncbi:hypothetical protein SAMN04490243_0652 [Robiginitalea myxolifaciens]|uniref:Pyridoxamine 5'-phosphate oxidase n=1 Tax=Robiginitalea myxolifaciens TaxID=400055 RepID=A0A1I6FTT2_9FLAO|nr:pyridoxamine 5'-phosphate oxidase family protein [Robiginitalea myxolifaciens]SFR33318.1 hypothetical protein SAMN04490243_0652 [Robiginitalea myxolifaciens]
MRVLSDNQCLRVLEDNYIGRLGFISGGGPTILPVTYFYDADGHCIISYSGEGTKIEAMRENGTVALQVDTIISLDHWESVLVHGTYEELSGIDARHLLHKFAEGVRKILLAEDARPGTHLSDISSKVSTDKAPVVYRITIDEITGRKRP